MELSNDMRKYLKLDATIAKLSVDLINLDAKIVKNECDIQVDHKVKYKGLLEGQTLVGEVATIRFAPGMEHNYKDCWSVTVWNNERDRKIKPIEILTVFYNR